MTNGEKIQKLFNCEVCEPIFEDNIIHVIFADKPHSAIGFDWDWWLAEYKEPTTKNDLGVDCISRADARKAIIDHQYSDNFCKEHDIDHSINTGMALIVLSDLPSVIPQEPRKGHWINKQHLFESCSAECSSCHKQSNGYMHDNGFSLECKYYDFCPKCGADMREVVEGK